MTGSGSLKYLPDLDEDEKIFLNELFQEEIAPKLKEWLNKTYPLQTFFLRPKETKVLTEAQKN